jgi:hypothetical protein
LTCVFLGGGAGLGARSAKLGSSIKNEGTVEHAGTSPYLHWLMVAIGHFCECWKFLGSICIRAFKQDTQMSWNIDGQNLDLSHQCGDIAYRQAGATAALSLKHRSLARFLVLAPSPIH